MTEREQGRIAWLAERLSDRDWRILAAMNRLRLMSGEQLERLCFAMPIGHARTVVRGRVLRRLVRWQVLVALPRRIGGAASGSAESMFALGAVGARLCTAQQATVSTATPRVRHQSAPTVHTLRHTLAVSELYVSLVEQAGAQRAQVTAFDAEPASWWPNGQRGFMKPDAYVVLAWGNVREHWWVEVDLATESLPTIKRKLLAYLDFVERGQLGPASVVPRVLISAVTPVRCAALQSVMVRLRAPAEELFVVLLDHEAAPYMLQSLQQ